MEPSELTIHYNGIAAVVHRPVGTARGCVVAQSIVRRGRRARVHLHARVTPGRRRIIGSVGARAGRTTAGRGCVPRTDRYAQRESSPIPEMLVSSLSGGSFASYSSAAVTAILEPQSESGRTPSAHLPAPVGLGWTHRCRRTPQPHRQGARMPSWRQTTHDPSVLGGARGVARESCCLKQCWHCQSRWLPRQRVPRQSQRQKRERTESRVIHRADGR